LVEETLKGGYPFSLGAAIGDIVHVRHAADVDSCVGLGLTCQYVRAVMLVRGLVEVPISIDEATGTRPVEYFAGPVRIGGVSCERDRGAESWKTPLANDVFKFSYD
jgi:hypothetical protein